MALYLQLTSQAELLQNELNVVGSEGTEDRLSGAAHLLELTQQCEELRARLEESKATASQVHTGILCHPIHLCVPLMGYPSASFTRKAQHT